MNIQYNYDESRRRLGSKLIHLRVRVVAHEVSQAYYYSNEVPLTVLVGCMGCLEACVFQSFL